MRWWVGSTVPGKQAAGVHVIHVICVIRPWDELSYMPSALEVVTETLCSFQGLPEPRPQSGQWLQKDSPGTPAIGTGPGRQCNAGDLLP